MGDVQVGIVRIIEYQGPRFRIVRQPPLDRIQFIVEPKFFSDV